jgi:septum formation topological specificity factor MinE
MLKHDIANNTMITKMYNRENEMNHNTCMIEHKNGSTHRLDPLLVYDRNNSNNEMIYNFNKQEILTVNQKYYNKT